MTDTRKLAAVFGDVMTWVSENTSYDPARQRMILDRIAAGEYSDFKVDGDRATASFQPKYCDRALARLFLKMDGKWFVDIAETIRESNIEASP